MTRARSEDDIQVSVVKFLTFAVKRPDRFWFCPNGGNLSRAQAGKFKAMGLTPGISDLHFAWATGAQRQFPCYGVIEMKNGAGKESPEQIAFGKDMIALGHTYAVARSVEDVERTLRDWGFPLHASVLPSGAFKRSA